MPGNVFKQCSQQNNPLSTLVIKTCTHLLRLQPPLTTHSSRKKYSSHCCCRAMYVLFVTVPDHGHLWPLLQTARQLRKMEEGGHDVEVQFASLEHARSRVEAAGLPFLSLAAWTPEEFARYTHSTAVSFDTSTPIAAKLREAVSAMIEQLGITASQGLLARLEGAHVPDVIVTDSLTLVRAFFLVGCWPASGGAGTNPHNPLLSGPVFAVPRLLLACCWLLAAPCHL